LKWAELSEEGTLHSWTEVSFIEPEFDSPIVLGLIDLPQGIGRIVARVVGAEVHQLEIGMPVKITYADIREDLSLYCITIDQ